MSRARKLFAACISFTGLLGAHFPNAATSATWQPLAVTKPIMACADLAKVDLTALGGVGSMVTTAKADEVNKIAMCSVDVTLAPAIKISVKPPTQS